MTGLPAAICRYSFVALVLVVSSVVTGISSDTSTVVTGISSDTSTETCSDVASTVLELTPASDTTCGS